MINYQQTAISQYAQSPTILQLLDNANQWIDPYFDFYNFENWIWNIDTARGFGLDILGRILGITRRFFVINFDNYFGFSGTGAQPFNQAPFYNGASDADSVILNDEDYRRILLTKAFLNISPITALNINYALTMLFVGRGKCYVVDNQDMTVTYTFEFVLSGLDKAIINTLMPQIAGVSVTINEI
jgi:hypothetical protein